MSEEGRAKLRAYGIAPPPRGGGRRALFGEEEVACPPSCGSTENRGTGALRLHLLQIAVAVQTCREPFDYFKCH